MTVNLADAKTRLEGLKQQRAQQAAQRTRQEQEQAAVMAEYHQAVAQADLHGGRHPARPVFAPLPTLGDIEDRIEALRAAVERADFDQRVLELERLNAQSRQAVDAYESATMVLASALAALRANKGHAEFLATLINNYAAVHGVTGQWCAVSWPKIAADETPENVRRVWKEWQK